MFKNKKELSPGINKFLLSSSWEKREIEKLKKNF